ncbi:hypothetical protein B0T17DRAFT_512433 [Bombardia bombarda]|uniref:Uncharacterized protein n=1 Tax=Bombardia bombarda TaxID=252184 RepID=A0AA39TW88_9PEZI|nr:hypothetical protein B0T17DRAFT_512433 [Bombardia bombarda]
MTSRIPIAVSKPIDIPKSKNKNIPRDWHKDVVHQQPSRISPKGQQRLVGGPFDKDPKNAVFLFQVDLDPQDSYVRNGQPADDPQDKHKKAAPKTTHGPPPDDDEVWGQRPQAGKDEEWVKVPKQDTQVNGTKNTKTAHGANPGKDKAWEII